MNFEANALKENLKALLSDLFKVEARLVEGHLPAEGVAVEHDGHRRDGRSVIAAGVMNEG